ncbi:hypothetical protein NEPAR06_0154 [Nematocida parisii]|uniref:uncharacterized protein n=1 Tax=Nematocida parisii (strain ERTm1 / ATCC PRA-289) TaxID=881290 RepID=UPI000264B2F3|nr:uncharacterized protein NEPG_00544 [Nematocida parisii ERTm1]EIJ95019.1 hypothetical protein NEPG_00544 [Nematocida parisii ERTm1]KAI5143119.1 hypothetical protein NEPAR07_0481 [Nematocida parisii]KAI5153076.1 hypothetical protein NEPAR06_0154 [Nematocida parisii]KAI5158509.1 hypothetical protein NEPAR05_2043 [Nematocida parisii]|eukprot:XP_013058375.1 hypothetical protein NEPG_00544 [Nematocida parisii ERTm1]
MTSIKEIYKCLFFAHVLMNQDASATKAPEDLIEIEYVSNKSFKTTFNKIAESLKNIINPPHQSSALSTLANIGKLSNHKNGFTFDVNSSKKMQIQTLYGLLFITRSKEQDLDKKKNSKKRMHAFKNVPTGNLSIFENNRDIHNDWVISMLLKTNENKKIRDAAFLSEGLRLIARSLCDRDLFNLKTDANSNKQEKAYTKRKNKYQNIIDTMQENMIPMTVKPMLLALDDLTYTLLKNNAESLIKEKLREGFETYKNTNTVTVYNVLNDMCILEKSTNLTENVIDRALYELHSAANHPVGEYRTINQKTLLSIIENLIQISGLYKIATLKEEKLSVEVTGSRCIPIRSVYDRQITIGYYDNYTKLKSDLESMVKTPFYSTNSADELWKEDECTINELKNGNGSTIKYARIQNGKSINTCNTEIEKQMLAHQIKLSQTLREFIFDNVTFPPLKQINSISIESEIINTIVMHNTFGLSYSNDIKMIITPIPECLGFISNLEYNKNDQSELYTANILYKNALNPENEYTLYKYAMNCPANSNHMFIAPEYIKINPAKTPGSTEYLKGDSAAPVEHLDKKITRLCNILMHFITERKDKTKNINISIPDNLSIREAIKIMLRFVLSCNIPKGISIESMSSYSAYQLTIAMDILNAIADVTRCYLINTKTIKISYEDIENEFENVFNPCIHDQNQTNVILPRKNNLSYLICERLINVLYMSSQNRKRIIENFANLSKNKAQIYRINADEHSESNYSNLIDLYELILNGKKEIDNNSHLDSSEKIIDLSSIFRGEKSSATSKLMFYRPDSKPLEENSYSSQLFSPEDLNLFIPIDEDDALTLEPIQMPSVAISASNLMLPFVEILKEVSNVYIVKF